MCVMDERGGGVYERRGVGREVVCVSNMTLLTLHKGAHLGVK